jgi:hypothetical protein
MELILESWHLSILQGPSTDYPKTLYIDGFHVFIIFVPLTTHELWGPLHLSTYLSHNLLQQKSMLLLKYQLRYLKSRVSVLLSKDFSEVLGKFLLVNEGNHEFFIVKHAFYFIVYVLMHH